MKSFITPIGILAGVRLFLIAAAVIVKPCVAVAAEENAGKVGDFGDAERLEFSGNATFSADSLRRALAFNPGYLYAAHPENTMDRLLQMLRGKILAGYEHNGFPEAQVAADFDAGAGRIRVTIVEGRRCRCGDVKVIGAKHVRVRAIVDRLTKPAPDSLPPLKLASLEEATHKSGDAKPKDEKKKDDWLWSKGEPADFSKAGLDHFAELVTNCLAEHGLFFPKIKVHVETKPASPTAELRVEILDEGPLGTVAEFEITGNRKNSSDEIIRFLGLKPGMAITRSRITEAEQKLWNSARFLKYEITPAQTQIGGANPGPGRLRLRINVREYEPAPKLSAPLSDLEKASLRLGDWLSEFKARPEDLVVSVSSTRTNSVIGSSLEGTISPREGLVLLFRDSEKQLTYGVLFAKRTMGFYAIRGGQKFPVTDSGMGTSFGIGSLPNESDTADKFSTTFSVGFSSVDSNAPPFRLDLNLAPVAFLGLAHEPWFEWALKDGQLVLIHSNAVVKVEAATGRLREASYRGPWESARVQFVDGAFRRARQELEIAGAGLSNRFVPGHPLSSGISFFAGEIARWKLLDLATNLMPADQRVRAASALDRLLTAEVLAPLEREWISTNEANAFGIPADELDLAIAQNKIAEFAWGAALKYGCNLFPENSWPRTLAREAVFLFAGRSEFIMAELNRLYESPDTGPLGMLAIARVLANVQPLGAAPFASRGLTRLSAAEFRNDWRLLLAGDSGLARSFVKIAARLRDLPPEDVDALAGALPETEADLLRHAAQALRSAPSQPPAASLAPVLDEYWDKALRARVSEALTDLLPPKKD